MKKLLPILFVLIITSCSKEVPSDQLVERDGVYYEVNSQTPFTGTTFSNWDNGQLKYKGKFIDGKHDGLHESFHESGQLWSTKKFIDGKEDGLHEDYHENGQLWMKSNYKDGNLDGVYENYDEKGQLISKSCLKNGKQTDMSYCEK